MNSEEPRGATARPGAIQAGKALDLADCVSYQHGSTVSRAIHDDENATITPFAFDAGQSLSEHTPLTTPMCWWLMVKESL